MITLTTRLQSAYAETNRSQPVAIKKAGNNGLNPPSSTRRWSRDGIQPGRCVNRLLECPPRVAGGAARSYRGAPAARALEGTEVRAPGSWRQRRLVSGFYAGGMGSTMARPRRRTGKRSPLPRAQQRPRGQGRPRPGGRGDSAQQRREFAATGCQIRTMPIELACGTKAGPLGPHSTKTYDKGVIAMCIRSSSRRRAPRPGWSPAGLPLTNLSTFQRKLR